VCGEQPSIGVEWSDPQPTVEMPWDIDEPESIQAVGYFDEEGRLTFGTPEESQAFVHVTEVGTSAGELLREAANIVDGARNTQHGDKERSFQTIAQFWNNYLNGKAREAGDVLGVYIQPSDVAQMMVLLKVSRSIHGEQVRDHYVDEAGYAAVAGELAEREISW